MWRAARDALLKQIPNLYSSEKQAASSDYLHEHFDEIPLLILGYGPAGTGALTVVPACWTMCLAARGLGLGSTFTTLLASVAAEVDAVDRAFPPTVVCNCSRPCRSAIHKADGESHPANPPTR